MSFLQGNTYLKPIQVLDDSDKVVRADKVVKGEFTIGDIFKYYGEGGDVQWSMQEDAFIVPLTEEDTFSLKPDTTTEVQVRLVLDDGSVSGSLIERHYVYRTKSKTRLTESGAGERTGEILQIKLLKEVGAGGGTTDYNYLDNKPSINGVELVGNKTTQELGIVSEETDPTVPQYVKGITEEDIFNWNSKASESYVNEKIAELVNSAPDTLNTLGELADAIQENGDVVEALNNAINDKADKAQLDNYYTKEETYSKAEVDEMFGADGANLLKVSPFVVAESSQTESQVAITDESGSNYILGLEYGKAYTIKYVVEDVTYEQDAIAYKYPAIDDGVYILGMTEDMQSPVFTFAIGDGMGGLVIMQDGVAEMATYLMATNMSGNAYIPSIKVVSIREKAQPKYYTKAETEAYVQSYVDGVVGDINTALENILGV